MAGVAGATAQQIAGQWRGFRCNQAMVVRRRSAGDAVNGNSYITWVATGTRYGAIV